MRQGATSLLLVCLGCVQTFDDSASLPEGLRVGADALVRISPAPLVECPYGGHWLESGTDQDADRVLSDDEVSASQVVCNGEQGPAGVQGTQGPEGPQGAQGQPAPRPLFATVAAEPSSECPLGGAELRGGIDDNQNGTLEDTEVSASVPVCRTGENVLFGQTCDGGDFAAGISPTGHLACATPTDSDTLRALGCLPDQIPRRLSSGWVCADDETGITGEIDPTVNALARASLDCLQDQRPSFDGVDWRCDDDKNSDLLREITCGDGQVLKFASGQMTWACAADQTAAPGSDTLASLSCTDGQIAKFDIGSGLWFCADDQTAAPGSDTLASLSCGEGELAKWSQTDLEWQCASDATGLTAETDPTVNALGRTTLSCGNRQVPVLVADTDGDPQWVCMDYRTYSGADFARSGQGCDVGRFATGVTAEGQLSCSTIAVTETDPTVLASVKDGVGWSELSGIPAGFADGVDDGLTSEEDPTVNELAQADLTSCLEGQLAKYSGGLWVCADDVTSAGGGTWNLNGNSGTTTGTDFVGTTDNVALEFKVNGQRALRLEPGTTPSLVAGYSGNSVSSSIGSVVAGGGKLASLNTVTDDYGFVGGGSGNVAGDSTGLTSSAAYAAIAGGEQNIAVVDHGFIGGGKANTVYGSYSLISGGAYNNTLDPYCSVGGGYNNFAGYDNGTFANWYATVGGGRNNNAQGFVATIAGGQSGKATGMSTTVGGGAGNEATADYATSSGGGGNRVSGQYSTIPGGDGNTVTGARSVAMGYNSYVSHAGSLVFSDYDPLGTTGLTSIASNEFAVRAKGGVRFVTQHALNGTPTYTCSIPGNGAGGLSCTSDAATKENFAAIDGEALLAQINAVPVWRYNFKWRPSTAHHIGPTAQDFHGAFDLEAADHQSIPIMDMAGITFAGVQALTARTDALADTDRAALDERQRLLDENQRLRARVGALELRMQQLEQFVLARAAEDNGHPER